MKRNRLARGGTFLAAVVLPAALPATGSAQLPEDVRLHEPFLAWERGDYPTALRGYLELLDGPEAHELVTEIAALTGEVFQVTELAEDGRDAAVGPDGRYAVWRTSGPDGESILEVADLGSPEGPAVVATLEGSDPALSGDGRIAYFTPPETPELARAAEAAQSARESGDRNAYFQALRTLRWLEAAGRVLRLRELDTGEEEVVALDGWIPGEVVFGDDGALYVVAGAVADNAESAILRVDGDGVRALETGDGYAADPMPVPGSSLLVHALERTRPVPASPDAPASPEGRTGLGILDVESGDRIFFPGAREPALSADGSVVAWLGRRDGLNTLQVAPLGVDAPGEPLVTTEMDLADPALSPDGRWVAYRKRPVHDWEIFAAPTGIGGSPPGRERGGEVQLSWEIQHDLFPVFLDGTTVMAAKGEGRHRRAFLYDVAAGGQWGPGNAVTRLFHNNLVRTISPEYEWVPTPDGRTVLVVSERDGDTVSPERSVHLVHLDRPVTLDAVRERIAASLEMELDLRERGRRMFADLETEIRPMTEAVDVGRIYADAAELYTFGSKYITEPGNAMAADHLVERLRSFGYEPELQWFEPRPGIRTANVIARLPGTRDPELVYVVSSHYDSTRRGPGADDDSSGTTALLEVARVMRDHPQPATIELAFFTGEEAGLLGSREYVRRAVADGKRIVGALNNDMVGWSNGPRLDNTIRYSNPGIRDVQHNAAILFSDLVTYDALYYKSTDAHAYYEEYGDIVGGIGSYPVLGNPHYHRFTDRLNTVNHRLVAEVARTTVGTVALLASTPSRVTGLAVETVEDGARVAWEPSPEGGVVAYEVAWTDRAGMERTTRSDGPRQLLPDVRPGTDVRVWAVDADGRRSWDGARAEVPRGEG